MTKKPTRPVIALLYDFDHTLCTKDMQEYSFIPSLGIGADAFWSETAKLSKKERMDRIIAYMYMMIRMSKEKQVPIKRDVFVALGKDIKFFKGVETWFGRMNKIGDSLGLDVEHYIISSGIKEIIEGSSIAKEFKEIFACEFHYEENGVADWPKAVVNYTTKTQFLFRINKGVLDPSEDDELNRYTPEANRRVPFRNMIYIGDGMSDVPCMKLVKVGGGKSIAVYVRGTKDRVKSLIDDGRVDFILPADYSEGSRIEGTVRDILNGMAIENRLFSLHEKQTS